MHTPVLQKKILEGLSPKPNENFIDATFGFGGHATDILKRIRPNGKLIGIEIDPAEIKTFKEDNSFNQEALDRLILVNDSYVNLSKIAKENDLRINGILFDLGLSSWHFEKSNRGFSFRKDEALDMRFNPEKNQLTAFEIVNYYKEDQIEKILKEFAQEDLSKIIARNIIKARDVRPIRTTSDLLAIIMNNLPKWYKRRKIHPATKTFQALRMAVNNELETIRKGIEEGVGTLEKNGRIAVISFHSLEDKIIKEMFKDKESEGKLKIITKKPITAKFNEVKANPRSRSAKLRIAIKI
ncbi:MAG: 16S rRNA (cytosine(1402)-N(4))-methyltransferase RsmH [Candidatus Pacebacteria bacterium]|nr:16S rRNA (cytosine(1402)-N(4))-methyltransferase RsmH [Candidatus Paceibacterota bacterium]